MALPGEVGPPALHRLNRIVLQGTEWVAGWNRHISPWRWLRIASPGGEGDRVITYDRYEPGTAKVASESNSTRFSRSVRDLVELGESEPGRSAAFQDLNDRPVRNQEPACHEVADLFDHATLIRQLAEPVEDLWGGFFIRQLVSQLVEQREVHTLREGARRVQNLVVTSERQAVAPSAASPLAKRVRRLNRQPEVFMHCTSRVSGQLLSYLSVDPLDKAISPR
jgi:hypothetical protein